MVGVALAEPWLMSMQVVLIILLCACGLVGIWRSLKGLRGEERRLPPGPPAWPIIGHLHLLGKLPHQALAELARRHAPHLMSLRLGSVPFVVASSPQAAKLILHTHDRIFASRPRSAASRYLTFNSSDIAFSPESPYWRRMRGLCASDLFTKARIRSFEHVRREEVQALLCSVLEKRGQAVELRPMLVATTLNMVSRMTIGQRLSELEGNESCGPLSGIGNLIQEVMHLVGLFNVGDFFPFLGRLGLLRLERRMKLVGSRLNMAMQVLLDLRRAAMKAAHKSLLPKDLLDVLLAEPDINDDNVKGVISNMFIGGAETISVTVEWVLAELLSNPTTLCKLKEELDQVVGKSRLVEDEDIPNLPYLHVVVMESMRLHPPGPLLIPHESIEACQVCDYIIPSKTHVLVNVWAIGRDPNVWENPLKFEPERFFLQGRYNHDILHDMHFELIPFGSGRRKCPALHLALLNVHIIVASLLQSFDWSFDSSTSKTPIDLSEKYGLSVTMASPLTITLIPSMDASLYKNAI